MTITIDTIPQSVFPPRSQFRRRHGRCYELAWKTLADLHDTGKADGVTLVHGTILLPSGCRTGHAWLEDGTYAYDAVWHTTQPLSVYALEQGAVTERRYTFPQVCEMAAEKSHWGPWHESAPGTVFRTDPR